MNRVVARYADGRIVKGATVDFSVDKEAFHLSVHGAPSDTRIRVDKRDLKALFFVKDFAGNPEHAKSAFDPARRAIGRKLKVEFQDGEIMVGTTMGYRCGRAGFFLEPADPASNNERCYVLEAATREVSFIEEPALDTRTTMNFAPGYA